MMYHYGFYNPFAGVVSILFWVLVIILIFSLIRHAGRGRRFYMRDFHRDGAMDILREKYAKGEITKEEFESKKKDLMM